MNSSIWGWEMQRLSRHLRAKYPSRKFAILLDNVGSHKMVEFPNINYIFLPKNSTAITQPLDCSVFACVKNKYASWLMKKYVEVGPENVTMEQCILSYASIFNGLDVRVINNGFKKTKIEKFQSEETLDQNQPNQQNRGTSHNEGDFCSTFFKSEDFYGGRFFHRVLTIARLGERK